MAKVAVVYHSKYGHTKLQAEAVARGAAKLAEATLMTADEASNRLDELDGYDAIVFGCPTYMGSMSAGMKGFVEAAAKKWFTLAWKDKVAGAFTNSSSYSGDKLNTLLGLMVNAMQHGMIYVGTGVMPAASDPDSMNRPEGPGPEVTNRNGSSSGPMATSFQLKPGQGGPSEGDLKTAEDYGERVAAVTARWLRGKA